jgi:hypothetical protein
MEHGHSRIVWRVETLAAQNDMATLVEFPNGLSKASNTMHITRIN